MSGEEGRKEIPFEEHVEGIRASHRLRGLYLAFIYDELKKRYGKKTTKDILNKAIFKYGEYQAKHRIKQNPKLKAQGALALRPAPWSVFMHKTILLEETPERIARRIYVCPVLDAVKELGKTEEEQAVICDMAMFSSAGQSAIYRDEIGITTNWFKKMCHGDPYCEQEWTKVKRK